MVVEQAEVNRITSKNKKSEHEFPGQVVFVFQGGGALGAYQAGVYEAFHAAGIEPDWVVGTSIGAINGAIIAGNPFEQRIDRLRDFWNRVERNIPSGIPFLWPAFFKTASDIGILASGVSGFFSPNPAAAWGLNAKIGVERAAFYSAESLKESLSELVDFERLRNGATRFTVGAVNVRSSELRYFDNRNTVIGSEHVMASSALPPAFPAVLIDGESYWDGGIYSNTPLEVVFDDNPRKDSVVFAVQVWHSSGPQPETIWQVFARHKDIQFASRSKSHIARQEQIHHLRHIIRELAGRLPESERNSPKVQELAGYGCGTIMHIVQLNAPRLEGEDHLKDIDFTKTGIAARWQAGYADGCRILKKKPWQAKVDPVVGIAVHNLSE